MELTADVEAQAGVVAARHALGALDAIHLASAMLLGADVTVLATWDRRLHAGAVDAGLTTFPATWT